MRGTFGLRNSEMVPLIFIIKAKRKGCKVLHMIFKNTMIERKRNRRGL